MKSKTMKVIGIIVTTLGLMIYSSILNGWAFSKLWQWFMVPTFNLAALSIPSAIGIGYVVSYLTHQIKEDDEDRSFSEKMIIGVVQGTCKPIFALLFGAIVAQFM